MSSLETHYRRLLRWYPADHRRRHEDEMLGVLLASAEPGQDRPGLAERADLVLGAIEIRLSRALSAVTRGWGDALALVSVIAPLLLLGQYVAGMAGVGLTEFVALEEDGGFSESFSIWGTSAGFVLLSAIIAAAALRRARITAAALAWIFLGIWLSLAWPVFWSDNGPWGYGAWFPATLVVTALALTVGRGPARGLELIGPRRLLLLGAISAIASTLDQVALSSFTLSILQLAPPAIFAAIGGLAMGRPVTRRAAVVLAVPVHVSLTVFSLAYAVSITYLLPAIVFVVVAALTIRRKTNSSETPVAA